MISSPVRNMTQPMTDIDMLRQECNADTNTLEELRARFGQLTELTIMRHLVVCNNDLEATAQHIENAQTWRETMFPIALTPPTQARSADSVRLPVPVLYTYGYDFGGRPLLIFTPQRDDIKTQNIDELYHWCVYMFEFALKRLSPDNPNIQLTILVNQQEKGVKSDSNAVLISQLSVTLKSYYPARVRKVLFFPGSSAVDGAWSELVALAPEHQTNTLQQVHSLENLRTHIPDEYIPAELGGSCTYEFSMEDYPSPFTEGYSSMVAGYRGSDDCIEINLGSDELYYPEEERGRDHAAALPSESKCPPGVPAEASAPSGPSTPGSTGSIATAAKVVITVRSSRHLTATPRDGDGVQRTDYERLKEECASFADDQVIAQLKNQFKELSEVTLMRHLIICRGDKELASTRIEECQLWRQTTFPMSACDYSQGSGLFVHGQDRMGHPLFVYTPRLNNIKTRNIDELVRWSLYMLEIAVKRMPPNVVQYTILVNRKDIKATGNADYEFLKRGTALMERYYPARAYEMLFYPVSFALKSIFRVIKRLVVPRFADKLILVRSLDKLRMRIPDEYIPAELGGSCTYKFSMKDYPSPFTEDYSNMVATHKRVIDVAPSRDDLDVSLEDLYYPQEGDNVDGLALTQASVNSSFVEGRTPISKGKALSVGKEMVQVKVEEEKDRGSLNRSASSSSSSLSTPAVAVKLESVGEE